VLQAVCAADHQIQVISILCPGSANDARAWAYSSLEKSTSRRPEPYYILGDAAYPLSDKLLTPYSGAATRGDRHKDAFNFYQSQLRIRIEMSFGLLVARWGILWRPMRVSLRHVPHVVHAVVRLHNLCIRKQDASIPREAEDAETLRWRPHELDERFRTRRVRSPAAADRNETRRDRICDKLQAIGLVRPRGRCERE
jgi:hypothetical protein